MFKKLFTYLIMISASLSMRAQTTECVRTFSSACGQAGNVSFSVGQPFYQQIKNASDLEIAEGVQQAQILYNHIVLDGCQNDEAVSPTRLVADFNFFRGYDSTIQFNGEELFILPAGHYDSTDVDSRHYSWDGPFNYDSVTTMVLDVWPIYEKYDTLRLDIHDMQGFDEGDNDRTLATLKGCDSLVHYYVLTCGEDITDADGNLYNTLFVGRYCWTQQNLQPTHYTNGEDIPNNMIYYSQEHPNRDENLEQYGRLYTWYDAVNLPEGSTDDPVLTDGIFVQGLCPEGWHIPYERNMENLVSFGAPALKSTNLWLEPGNNSTRFTAYPAGVFNPNTNRFENMLGETRYWTDHSSADGSSATNGVLTHSCSELVIDSKTKNYGFSVRCVKNQIGNL